MIRLIFILIVILISSSTLLSQTKNDSIVVKESRWGSSYYINGNYISKSRLTKLLEENSFSQDLIRSSSRKNTWGSATLAFGLVLTGISAYECWESNYSYGHAPTSGTFYPLAAMAVLGDILGIVLISDGQRKFRETIEAYNKNLPTETTSFENRFHLYLGLNGIMLSYTIF